MIIRVSCELFWIFSTLSDASCNHSLVQVWLAELLVERQGSHDGIQNPLGVGDLNLKGVVLTNDGDGGRKFSEPENANMWVDIV